MTVLLVVEKTWEDFWLGVKGQTKLVIAGFFRKIFRYCKKKEL